MDRGSNCEEERYADLSYTLEVKFIGLEDELDVGVAEKRGN